MIFKYLHILTMFAAVTLMFGGELLFHLARRTGDPVALRRFLDVVFPVFGLGVALLTVGVAFGLLAAVTIGFDLTAGWLLLAYALIIAIYALGFGVGVPYFRRVRRVLGHHDSAAGAPELRRVLDDRRGIGDLVVATILYAAIIFVMVMKPDL